MNPARRLLTLAVIAAALGVMSCGRDSSASTNDPALLVAHLDGGDGGRSSAHAGDGGSELEDVAMPQGNGDELSNRMRHLLEAIAQNNADLAGDVVFPRDAYVLTRDVSDPQKAWERKVSGAFRRSVERMHRKMKGVENAKFVSFELGHSLTQLTPKKRDFKRPLWRVKHSKLTFTIDGKTRHIDIAEMTAWRGAWYVTRLR